MSRVLSDSFMDGPFWPHLAGDAHIGESHCRRAENGGPCVCFAAPAVMLLLFVWACSSCASAHHHNCKRCSSGFVFASVQLHNCVALFTIFQISVSWPFVHDFHCSSVCVVALAHVHTGLLEARVPPCQCRRQYIRVCLMHKARISIYRSPSFRVTWL